VGGANEATTQQSKDMIDALTAARTALPPASATLTKDSGQLFITGYAGRRCRDGHASRHAGCGNEGYGSCIKRPTAIFTPSPPDPAFAADTPPTGGALLLRGGQVVFANP